jgi:transcriptional regulator with XRE-family HTH domain
MDKRYELSNNKIGSAIQYFREFSGITQGELCKGLCSVATLSRIEAGERDADALLLETLLERLGRMPNQFELILTDFDYLIYVNREEIKKQLHVKNVEKVEELLIEYEKTASSKGNTHMQFISYSRALLNELHGGEVSETIDLLMEAISYTVPDFKTYRIKDYHLSNSELGIIIEIIQRMILAGITERAKNLLEQILEYLELQAPSEENNSIYMKVIVLASRLYMQEDNLQKAGELCAKGLERSKGNRRIDYLGELFYIKARTTEEMLKLNGTWNASKEKCLKIYLQAYNAYYFCEEQAAADKIKKYLQEEYQWADID